MRLHWMAFVAFFAFAPTHVHADEEGEDVIEQPSRAPGDDTVFLRRIVDASTGRPVADARVDLHCEVPHPVPGARPPVASAKSGPDGWVHIRKADLDRRIADVYGEPTWAYVEAPGLGPDADFKAFLDKDWELTPTASRRIALRDLLDRPVADALVGFLLGCGHTPDVLTIRTDAHGDATIDRASESGFGQVWVVKDGVESKYVEDAAYFPWQRRRSVTLDWAMTVEGTVLTHDGKPAAGVAVGHPNYHRGPWAISGPDGHFRLIGSDIRPGDNLQVESGEYPVGPASAPRPDLVAWTVPAPPPGHRAVVRLPAPGKESDEVPARVRLVVEVDREQWPEAFRTSNVGVHAVRIEDGWTSVGYVGEQGVALLDVPKGRYAVEALGRRADGEIVCSRLRVEVDVPATGGAYVRVELPVPAMLHVFGALREAKERTVELIGEGERQILEPEEGRIAVDALVPVGRTLALRITEDGRTRIQPVRSLLEPGEEYEVRVESPPPLELRAHLVGTDDKPAAGWLFELGRDRQEPIDTRSTPDGPTTSEHKLTVQSGARITWVAWPEDATKFQPSYVVVPPKSTDDQTVDIGVIRLTPRTPTLRFERRDGTPLLGVVARITHGTRSEERHAGEGAWNSTIVDPWESPGLLVEGAIVRVLYVDAEGKTPEPTVAEFPMVRRLDGPGPWTLRRAEGSLTVELAGGPDGQPTAWKVLLDGHAYDGERESAPLRLIGLEPGPHEVVVEAKGYVGRRLRFTLAAGESRTWKATLKVAAKPR